MARSRKHRRSCRMGGMGKRGMGSLIVAGVVGVAVGAGGYYLYLSSKSPAVSGMGLLNITRY